LSINEDRSYKKLINCINVTKLKNIGKTIFKLRNKWMNKV
jgi:hypothetical protein